MNIPFSTFEHMHRELHQDLAVKFNEIYESGWFIQGKEYIAFEKEYAAYCNSDYCVGVGNGLDAIYLILRALGIGAGDEVIVPSHTFIATALAVYYAGAKPVFCEVEEEYYTIDPSVLEKCITKRTKAIIVVQLYGQAADMDRINELANIYHIPVIEDAAQAHNASYKGKKVGSLATAAAFSFYPGKNLGALGDGGAITTNSFEIKEKVQALCNYGSVKKYVHNYAGVNSRLDELQAGFLRVKLKMLDQWTQERRYLAEKYLSGIKNDKLILPKVRAGNEHVWHLFVVHCDKRDELQNYLKEKGIRTVIHYPIPMHLQKAFADLNYKKGDFPIAEEMADKVLSLPLFIGMSDEEINYVIETINQYE